MSGRLSAGAAAMLCGVVIAVAGCSSTPSGTGGGIPTGLAAPTGGDAQDAPAAGAQRACTLLTTDEVSAALGTPVRDGAEPAGSDPLGRRDLCQWQSTAGPNLVVMILPGGEAFFTDLKGELKDSQPVDGVGDEAFYANSALTMRVDDVVIEFTVVGPQDGEKLAFYTDVAGKAAARV